MTQTDLAPSLPTRILRPFFSFRGRTNRAGFWTVSLTWNLLILVIYTIWTTPGAVENRMVEGRRVAAVLLLLFLPPLLSLIAVGVTRLHDRDKSGWWLLAFYLAPPVTETLAQLNNLDAAVTVWLMVISIVTGLWAFVELGCRRGTAGPNRYGPMPPTSETV